MKKTVTRKTVSNRVREYDFSSAVIGKYAGRYAKGTNVAVIARDLAAQFPDSAAVNRALRKLLKISGRRT